jgi:hypothetical protein
MPSVHAGTVNGPQVWGVVVRVLDDRAVTGGRHMLPDRLGFADHRGTAGVFSHRRRRGPHLKRAAGHGCGCHRHRSGQQSHPSNEGCTSHGQVSADLPAPQATTPRGPRQVNANAGAGHQHELSGSTAPRISDRPIGRTALPIMATMGDRPTGWRTCGRGARVTLQSGYAHPRSVF